MANWMVGESAFVMAAQNSSLYLMVVDLSLDGRNASCCAAVHAFSDSLTVASRGL